MGLEHCTAYQTPPRYWSVFAGWCLGLWWVLYGHSILVLEATLMPAPAPRRRFALSHAPKYYAGLVLYSSVVRVTDRSEY
eukprot:3058675-Amphidinium_carterae.1